MTSQKKKALIALKKSRTSIDGIIDKIERDESCVDIMQQNMAVMGLLKSAHQHLMENHLKTCFADAMSTENPELKREMIEEIITISKFASKFSCHWSLDNCSDEK